MTELYELPCPTCDRFTVFRHDSANDGYKIFSFKCECCGANRYIWKDKHLRRKQVDKLQKDREW